MSLLGYIVDTTAMGGFKIRREDGSAVDTGEFVSFPTYHAKWKRDYPNLKVSRPVEDICNLCYTFAHRHKFFTDHMMRCGGHGDDDDDDNNNEDDNDEDQDVVDELACLTRNININRPECASDKVAEEKEQMMLEAAEHIKMARAQRQLYQEKVEKARRTVEKVHLEQTYAFVVEYGQNMELPIFNSEQPGATYYYSPMTVNNLGMVDHAHIYPDRMVGDHMHRHVYTDAVGKKGANNVASLIMKTLRRLNLLCDDEQGSELNIVFDNCCGQKKKHCVEASSMDSPVGVFLGDQLYLPCCRPHKECGRPPLQVIEGNVSEEESVHVQPVGGGFGIVADYHSPPNRVRGLPRLWQAF
jgi:hypothetical protein